MAEPIAARGRDGGVLTTVVCRECGLLRSDPMPSLAELRQFYENEYRLSYKGVRRPKPRHVARAGRLALNRLRSLLSYVRPGDRVLDVGSGSGEWLYVLGRHGTIATGVEPDGRYVEFARSEYAVDAVVGDIGELQFEGRSFDAVTMMHVIEHLSDPVGALRRCLSCLSDRGRLIVEAPNMASPHQHPRKRFHTAHVVGFTPQTLTRAVVEAGGEVIEVRLDSFSRNVTVIVARGPDHAGAVAGPGPEDFVAAVRPQSTAAYCASPLTLYRCARRLAGFGREYVDAFGQSDPRRILDAMMATMPSCRPAAEPSAPG